MVCKYEGTGIWAGRCKGTKEVDPCPGYDKCERYKPDYKTNADRIRAMSDEELAKILNAFTEYFTECIRSADEVDCKDCELNNLCQLHEGKAIEWLQQPAE